MSFLLKKRLRTAHLLLKRCTSTAPETIHEQPKLKINHLNNDSTLLSQRMLKVKSKKLRERSGLAVLEGRRLIGDALKAGLQLESLFFSHREDLQEFINLLGNTHMYRLPYQQLNTWSSLETPPGLIAFVKLSQCKAISLLWRQAYELPVVVICDQLRDPGNLGALLRSCAAAGVSRVILMKGTADPWDSKVLRGGCGAHFKLSVETDASWDNISSQLGHQDRVLLAMNQPHNSRPYWNVPIPCNMDTSAEEITQNDMPALGTIYLVVGSESHGVSQACIQCLPPSIVSNVHIPLEKNIESLNSTIALSVILFDLKRRLTEKC